MLTAHIAVISLLIATAAACYEDRRSGSVNRSMVAFFAILLATAAGMAIATR